MKFSEMVYSRVKGIPRGRVSTYSGVAGAVRRPKAARAVGNALHRNPRPGVVPCHRVVRSDGSVGGYKGCSGNAEKIKLLENEGVEIRNSRVDLGKCLYRFL